MVLSKVCTVDSCKRSSQVVCVCCEQNFCIVHLNEHLDDVKIQLTPFVHELNKVSNQLKNESLVRLCFHSEIDKWCKDAHQTIDHFTEKKKQEFEEFFNSERDQYKIELNHLQNQINEFIREGETTKEDINSIKKSIESLQHQVDQFQLPQYFLSSLVIDDQLITIDKTRSNPNDCLPLSSPYKTIQLQKNLYSIAANDNFILAKRESKLCLLDQQLNILKEIPWIHSIILDMFWSSTLNLFIIITQEKIFILNEKTMYIQTISLENKKLNKNISWYCGTCSNEYLFVSTMGIAPSIYKYSLQSSFQLIEEYRSPLSCKEDEQIQDVSSNNHVLVILIENQYKEVYFHLCSLNTLQRRWSIKLNSLIGFIGTRCCQLRHDEWIIMNPNKSQLLHISPHGKIIKKDQYNPSPIHAVQINNDRILIMSENYIHLHQLS